MLYAMNNEVDRAGLFDFVRERKHWVLTTMRPSGGIQMSPVTGTIGSDESFMIATYPERAKALNIRRNGEVSICVLSDEFGGAWVQVDGHATIVDLPDAMEHLIDYYRSAAGEHPDWDDYRAAMERQEKCIIRIEVTDWGPVATGGFPSSKKAMFEKWESGGEFADDSQRSPQMFDD